MENVEGKTSPPRPPNWLSNTKYRPPGYFSGAITFSLRLLDGRRLTVALLLSYIHLLKTNNKYQEHHHHKPSTVNRPPSMKQILSILLHSRKKMHPNLKMPKKPSKKPSTTSLKVWKKGTPLF
jgi:hypothetical protein